MAGCTQSPPAAPGKPNHTSDGRANPAPRDAGSIAISGIELGFVAATASSLANPFRVSLQLITLAEEKDNRPKTQTLAASIAIGFG